MKQHRGKNVQGRSILVETIITIVRFVVLALKRIPVRRKYKMDYINPMVKKIGGGVSNFQAW